MSEHKYKVFFCTRYGELANRVCPKINSDDWDELEDCCSSCSARGQLETDVEEFDVRCIKDTYKFKKGDIVKAYVWSDKHFIVGGYITHIDEFKENFEVV